MSDNYGIEGNRKHCSTLAQGTSGTKQYFNNISDHRILMCDLHPFFWTSLSRQKAEDQDLERIANLLVKKQPRKITALLAQ